MNKIYQEQHNVQNNMRKKINKYKEGFGDRVMAKNFMSRLHLDLAEGHNPGGIPAKFFELNMGSNDSNLRYGEDGKSWIRVGKNKYSPIDIETGKIDDSVTTSGKKPPLNSGSTATVGNMETIAEALGYKIPPPPKNIDEKIEVGSIEGAKTGPGGKAFIYGINVSGERVLIGYQTVRPKSGKGTKAQDTIQFDKDFQTRMAIASAREADQEYKERPNESVSYRHIQTLIEMASKV